MNGWCRNCWNWPAQDAEFALTDIEQIVRRTVDLVQPHATKNHVETMMHIEDRLPPIHADAQQLQQVVLNLCLNAVDAMQTVEP